LDVGCGSGALSEAVITGCNPGSLTAIDQSDGFVRTAQQRLGRKAECRVGNALSLQLDDSSVDIAVAGLVLNFIPEPEKALAEMRRVTTAGGAVAIYVWDYAGVMEFLNHFWDVAADLNPDAASLHEGRRFHESNAEQLRTLFTRVRLSEVEVAPLEITTRFIDFEDYWKPFLGGQGPAPAYVSKLAESEKSALRKTLRRRLPIEDDGSISLSARAWAIRGTV